MSIQLQRHHKYESVHRSKQRNASRHEKPHWWPGIVWNRNVIHKVHKTETDREELNQSRSCWCERLHNIRNMVQEFPEVPRILKKKWDTLSR